MNQQTQQRVEKKTYISPCLVEYGSIAKLTQNGGTGGTDAMSMQPGGPPGGGASGGTTTSRGHRMG